MREHNDRAWMVWHIASLMPWNGKRRNPRMPALKALQAKRKREPQSWQQQLAVVKMWNALLGGKVVKKTDIN